MGSDLPSTIEKNVDKYCHIIYFLNSDALLVCQRKMQEQNVKMKMKVKLVS